ncbi:BMP family lipoprotein [Microvirga sp. G4-2]|uniref:BMP family lipoprotein n=1 Tax=Microvirga sp. G4-2 TaxID=3434467 RepID=UPI0040444912
MFDKWLDLEHQFQTGRISRRELFRKSMKYGLSFVAANAFVAAIANPSASPLGSPAWAQGTLASTEKLNVVMVTIQRAGDLGPVDAMISGLKRGAEELNYNFRVVEALQGEYQGAIEASAAEKPDLIIGLFPPMADPLERAARQHPDIRFANLVGIVPEGVPNLKSVWHAGQEGTFLTGALAGLVAAKNELGVESNTLGVVLAVENSEQHGYLAGYQQGYKTTNTNGTILHNVIGGNSPFEDPTKAAQLAGVLRERGAGIIGVSGGKSQHGVLTTARRARFLTLGMDNDQCLQYPSTTIASMLVFLDQWVYDVMNEVRTGTWKPGHHYVGLRDRALDICPYTNEKHQLGPKLPKVIHDTVANLREKVFSGEIKVAAKPAI